MTKRLIRKTALFLVGLALCLVAASAYYELRIRQQDDFYQQVAAFRNPAVQPTVLLVGDSRMAVGIDTQRLPKGVYNFSYPGETLRHLYLRIRYALETKPSIEYIVLGLEDVQFSDTRAHLNDAVEQMAFADLVALTEIYPTSLPFLLRHAVLHYLPLINPNYRRRAFDTLVADLQSAVFGSAASASTRAACGGLRFLRDDIWSRMTEEQRARYAREDVERLLGASAANPEMWAVFRKIVELARGYGVKVVGLRSPLSGAYIAAAEDAYDEPPLAFLKDDDLYGLLDYVDLQADTPDRFYDADHLNEIGAAEFTERLVADLRQIASIGDSVPPSCDEQVARATPVWPYHDVLSGWLLTPSCHNLKGTCGDTGTHGRSTARRTPSSRSEVQDAYHQKRAGPAPDPG